VPFDIDEELEKEFAKQKEDSDNFFPVSHPADRCTAKRSVLRAYLARTPVTPPR
jgi:hypothetical protein